MKKLFVLFLLQIALPVFCLSQNHKIDSLFNELKTSKEDSNKVKVLYGLRDLLYFNNLTESSDYNKKGLELAKKLNFKEGIITGYIFAAGIDAGKGNFTDALNGLNKAIPIVKQYNNRGEFAYLYNSLSGYFRTIADYSSAMDYSNKALQIADETNDSVLIADIIQGRAAIYRYISDYPTAISYYFEAIEIDQRRNDILSLSANYYRVAEIYRLEHDNNKAIDYLNRAYKIAQETDSRLLKANDLISMGEIYFDEKEWERSLDYFQQAMNIEHVLEDSIQMSIIPRNMAMIYDEQGYFNKAIQSASAALQMAEEIKNKPELCNVYECMGEIFMKQKNYNKAISYLHKGLDIANAIGQKNNQGSICKDLAESYEALNDYKSTSIYLSEENAIKDTMFNEENAKKIIEIGGVYGFEKNEKEIALLTENKQIQTLQIKKQALLQKSLIAGIILVSILFFFIYRNYHTRQLLKLQTLRNKIASDLHDDIGSTLSSISIFTLVAREGSKEIIPMLDKIGEYSRNMLESMSDIVWSINPDNDNFEKIILRMRSFAFELLRTKNIDFEFDADESLDSLKVSMELRKNLYLIFKEATNNMAKYSEASSAMFSITSSKNVLTMIIRDNGKGFDPAKNKQGNGLKNMKKRAEEIGAIFLIESEPGVGTTIQLSTKAA